MEEHHDDSSHYEVSLTATQALIAFVLLLASLGASFGFGIMVGKGGGADRLVVQREPAVINEASAAPRKGSRIVELGVKEEQPAVITDSALPPNIDTAAPSIIDEPAAAPAEAPPAGAPVSASGADAPFYAQLLSTQDSKSAEALAVRLIERGFPTAFVDQAATDQGTVFRVRVKFPDETTARAAVDQLKTFAPGEVWVTSR